MCFDQIKAQLDFRFNSKQYNSLNVVQDYTDMVFSMFFILELNTYPNHPIKIISLRIIQWRDTLLDTIKVDHFHY